MVVSNPFITWLISFLLAATGVFWMFHTGVAHIVFGTDFTYISWGLFAIGIATSLFIGLLAWRIQVRSNWLYYNELDPLVDIGWFVSSILPQIGFIGTVIGIAYMFQTQITGVTITDIAAVSKLMASIGEKTGTALYPTLVGLAASIFIKVQLFVLQFSIEGLGHEEKSPAV